MCVRAAAANGMKTRGHRSPAGGRRAPPLGREARAFTSTSPPRLFFNVTVSITDDLFGFLLWPGAARIRVTQRAIPAEFLKRPGKHIWPRLGRTPRNDAHRQAVWKHREKGKKPKAVRDLKGRPRLPANRSPRVYVYNLVFEAAFVGVSVREKGLEAECCSAASSGGSLSRPPRLALLLPVFHSDFKTLRLKPRVETGGKKIKKVWLIPLLTVNNHKTQGLMGKSKVKSRRNVCGFCFTCFTFRLDKREHPK